jgi:hypothetical protein
LAKERRDKRELPANASVDLFINVLRELFIKGILNMGLRYDFPVNHIKPVINNIKNWVMVKDNQMKVLRSSHILIEL